MHEHSAEDRSGRNPLNTCTNGQPDVIEIAVRFVASQPDGAARILAIHRRRANGCCTGCATTPVRWPCTAATIAIAATKNGQGTT